MSEDTPQSWAVATIADVAESIFRGKSPRYIDHSSLPVVNQKAIRWFGIQDEYLKFVHPDQFDQWHPEDYIREGDILWNSTGTGTIGRACLVSSEHLNPPKVIDSHVTVIRPDKEAIDPRYLFAWIRSTKVQNQILDLSSGSTNQIELNRTTVASTQIPFAPLHEQKRIASKLDVLLARVEACQGRLGRASLILKRFRQAVRDTATSGHLTEDWRENEELWQTSSLGSMLIDIRYGTSKKSLYELQDGVPVLRIPNIGEGKIDASDLKFGHFTKKEQENLALKEGDLLLIRSNGSVELIGKTAIVEPEFDGYLFAGYLIRLRADTSVVNPNYLSLFLSSSHARKYIERTARSTNGIYNINSQEVRAIQINLPPLEEQDEIIRRVEAIFTFADYLEARCQAAITRVKRLTPTLLDKAFRGELVPQDSNDEPALVLLERIRAIRRDQPPKSKKPLDRKSSMIKMTVETVKEMIRQFPTDMFSFDDLRKSLSGDYEGLKDILFVLLDEVDPSITQVFDSDAMAMRFVRRQK